jgi:hypothetical protein
MTTYVARHRVARPIRDVFDFMGTRYYENHARWEREVVEVRPLTDGPISLGSRAVMVRQDLGRRRELVYEVTEFAPPHRIAFRHLDSGMRFEIAFALREVDDAATDLAVSVRMEPRGVLRLAAPFLAASLPRTSERITRSLVDLLDAEAPAPAAP